MTEERSTMRMHATRAVAGVASALALVAFAGCGSSSDGSSSSTGTSSTKAVADVPFDSPEAGLPATFPEPKVKPGFHYTVGYLSPNTSIGFLAAVAKGVKDQTE